MRIDATINVSMVDACHIVPFRESYDDTITNGIALCPNLHRAFDRGLITIDKNYRVVIAKIFKEEQNNYAISIFQGKQIELPDKNTYFPLMENFEKHRNKFRYHF
jgi:putative restriction endonuclease